MTKCVRVENADISSYEVIVQVWNKSMDPEYPDVMEREEKLSFPTALMNFYIHSNNYLVIKEA